VVHGNNAMVADDPETFATHLVACLQDAALRRRLGRAGHEIAATQFTHAAAAQRCATLYRGLLRLQADTPAAARPAVTATRKAGSHAR